MATLAEKKREFPCPYCTHNSTTRYAQKRHLTTHKTEKPYECPYCNYSTAWDYNLKSHILHRHSPNDSQTARKFLCEICAKTFFTSQHLHRHTLTHTGAKDYNCKFCGKEFVVLASQRYHDTICKLNPKLSNGTFKIIGDKGGSGSGSKRYLCEFCSYTSARPGRIKEHEATHTGDKPFKCSLCPYASCFSHGLKYHMRSHTNEKPFKCPDSECSYSAFQKSALTEHVQTHHAEGGTRTKQLVCSFCPKAFYRKQELKKHLFMKHASTCYV